MAATHAQMRPISRDGRSSRSAAITGLHGLQSAAHHDLPYAPEGGEFGGQVALDHQEVGVETRSQPARGAAKSAGVRGTTRRGRERLGRGNDRSQFDDRRVNRCRAPWAGRCRRPSR